MRRKTHYTKNPNPSPATRFKKGNSGNPGGFSKDKIMKKELKLWTRQSVAEAYSKYCNMPLPELRKCSDSLILPALEVIVARGMLRDRMTGEMVNIERILERIIGKVPIKQEIGGIDGVPLVPPQIVFETSGKQSKEGMGST